MMNIQHELLLMHGSKSVTIDEPSSIEQPRARTPLDYPINVSKVCGKMKYIEADHEYWFKRHELETPQGEFYFKLSNAVSSLKRYKQMINSSGHERKLKLQGISPPKVVSVKSAPRKRGAKSTMHLVGPSMRSSGLMPLNKFTSKQVAMNRVQNYNASIDLDDKIVNVLANHTKGKLEK